MNKRENPAQEISFELSIELFKICKRLQSNRKEFVLSHQLLKSGTSIGANLQEAIGGQSDRDFLSKLSISYKEARESHYWVKLLMEINYLDPLEFESLDSKLIQLQKILGSSIITKKRKMGLLD